MKDGRVLEAEEIWLIDDIVWYRQGKIIASIPNAEISRVSRTKPGSTTKANPSRMLLVSVLEAAPGVRTGTALTVQNLEKEPDIGDPQTGEGARILLIDGTEIEVDSVWDDNDRIGYRLGKIQAFIDRTQVTGVKELSPNLSSREKPTLPDRKMPFATGSQRLDQLILKSANKHQVDPYLIYLVIREESRFNHRAVSRAGARGLMQLMPGTARSLGVRNIHDPVQNVDAGTKYLKNLLQKFKGDVNLALAAYNAGEDAVLRYGRRIPPYRETRNYVRRINSAYLRRKVL